MDEPAQGIIEMIASRIRAVGHALRGLRETLLHEAHGRIEIACSAAALGLGILLNIGPREWLAVVFAITVVIAAECLNTAIEHLADRVSGEHDVLIGKAKDAAAAGVFVCVLGAAATGGIVFLPRLWQLFNTAA